ncbi:hypothetical protein [Natronomonas sp.]|jgi:hypothetical protein|uniref:hypothetical protein n=1 Tax=Natronomonas sp. TaxID=2184060 RepID=UPI00398979A9
MPSVAAQFVTAFEWLFGTFGPFLIPATLFVLGAVGYLFLYAIERTRRNDWSGEGQ